VIWPDRVTSCSDVFWTLTDYVTIDGVTSTTGWLVLEDQQWTSYNINLLDWSHGLLMDALDSWGDLEPGTTFVGDDLCDGSTCVAVSNSTDTGFEWDVVAGVTYPFEWTEQDSGSVQYNVGVEDIQDFDLGVDFTGETPAGAWGFADVDNGLRGRCDNIAAGLGCVNEDYIPTLFYDSTRNPLVGPVAQHIYDAQHGGLVTPWGEPGHTLQRDMNQSDINANRQAACGKVTVPPGDSCDEYPMASTFEGAAFNSDYSIRIVPKSANDSQGGLTGTFYNNNRVISDDDFLVDPILPNGTPSW
jgi:hypothetical protein